MSRIEIEALPELASATADTYAPVQTGGVTQKLRVTGLLRQWDVTAAGVLTTNTGAQNDVALATLITAALAAGAELYWPPGIYESAASIASLHGIRHRGPGAIRRGSDTFYVEPRSSQTNRLYLSSTGNAANDGLTSSQPMATPQNAFDALKNYGPVLDGTWRVECAAGTWNGSVHRHQHNTPSKNPVIVAGPSVGGHPNVPTAVFDGTVGTVPNDWCIRATDLGVKIDVRDVKFTGYTTTGLLVDYAAVAYFNNVHGVANGYSDVYFQGASLVRGGGGIWESPRGAMVNGCVDTTLGYNARILCSGNTQKGIEWSRGSEGHIDFIDFQDCAYAIDILHNSRAHIMGCDFKRSTVAAVRARSGGFYYDDLATPNNFNNGTADANAVNFLNYAGCGESDEDLWLSQSGRRRAFDKNSHTLTGTTALTALSTLFTGSVNSRVPAYWLQDATKKVLVRVHGRFVTASALSAVGVTLGGVEIDRITLTGGGPAANSIFYYECEIDGVAGGGIVAKRSRLIVDGMYPRLQQNSPTVTTSADLALTVNGKLANSGDSMNVFWAEAWLVG